MILLIVLAGVSYCSNERDEPQSVEVVSTPVPPFNPIALLGLRIEPTTLQAGGKVTMINGICNNTDKPVIAEVFLAVERKVVDPTIAPEVIVFIQRPPGQGEGRGAITPIEIGCTAKEPITRDLPPQLPAGEWRAFLEVLVRGQDGQEQREAEFSNYFVVLP